ncbi:hypothetical protein F5Y01DRAFT_274158 [Xylaria sp. FL0043]|nr:hypothetical protein F5Y01DRAFT_274158 [Xylaria sp. FL0043]
MWESVSPWLAKSPTHPEEGFHPYEARDDDSFIIPERPASKMSPRSGSSSAGPTMSVFHSGQNSPISIRTASPRSAPPLSHVSSPVKQQVKERPKTWGRWLGLGPKDSGNV